jgi:LPS export ABC transporter protein LptC
VFFYQELIVEDKPFTKGYSVDNLELRITDEEGHLSAKFNSPSLIRYTDSETVLIQKPALITYELGKQDWLFNSISAEYNHKLNEVKLVEQVRASTQAKDAKINFSSNDLIINLKSKLAQTENGISVDKELFSMTGDSARFDLKNDKIEVKNNVKVIYKSPK